MDRRHTGARADRVSALLARLLLACAVLLAALGLAPLALRMALPAWAWAFIAPDALALAVFAATRALTPPPDPRIYGG